ncbi:MAG: dTDP-4-dehydrorhamnose 3,5-epimerase family protein [Planctomycetota bacterium]
MKIAKTFCDGLYLLELKTVKDDRGWFARLSCKEVFASLGLVDEFPQVNQSLCVQRGVFRGLHYQRAPRAEAKLVRCVAGRILDVAVDIRRGSSTFLCWYATELAADEPTELYVGAGFAHGYLALTDGATVIYQSSQPYSPQFEGRVHYNDPRVGIVWPDGPLHVSEKDASTPFLGDDFDGTVV